MSAIRRLTTLAALALLAVPAAQASTPAFQLRQVDVSGYPVIGLVVRSETASAVPKVFEDGEAASGLSYHNLGSSKAIVVAVDHSTSMQGEPLKQAALAAEQLLNRKRQADLVEVVTFGSTALAQTTFSQSTIDADSVLSTLGTDSKAGTALYDAVVTSSANLKAQVVPGRVLVLLTDGRDVRSLASLTDALKAARRANVIVYTIALGNAYSAPLKKLARATGGSFYASATPATLASIYRRVASELNHIWRISYTTTARPGDHISIAVGAVHGSSRTIVLPGHSSHAPRTLIPKAMLTGAGGLLLLGLLFGLIVFLAVKRLGAVPHAERIKRLVQDHTSAENDERRQERGARPSAADIVARLNSSLRGLPQLDRIDRLVQTAAVPATAATVLVACIGLAFVLALFAAVTTSSATMGLFFFLVGLVGPLIALRLAASRRIRAFEDQLPEVLATVASSLRVGHGLKQALQTVAAEGAPPMNIELRRVLSESRLGRPLEEALVSMCERLGSDDLIYVATAVDVQSQVGGSLAGVFETVAETVRERQQHRRRVRAVTATGRATAFVMAGMPFGFLAILLLISPHYVTPFLTSHVGRVLMVISVLSISIGAFILNRIVSVKV